MKPAITALIATAGRPDLLRETLCSIAQAEKPERFIGVTVVENGERCGAESICRDVANQHDLDVSYLYTPEVGKSRALNVALRGMDDATLVLMTDDDVLFDSQVMMAYARHIQPRERKLIYGGPFHAIQEEQPPEWLTPYLPLSAKGYYPSVETFDPHADRFIGFNWAAYAGDLKEMGGFDPRFGPGSDTGATGQESNMQIRLHAAGWRSELICDAIVSHHVPVGRCTPQWALHRAYRYGIQRGVSSEEKPLTSRFTDRTVKHLQVALRTIGLPFQKPEKQFRSRYKRSKQQGFLKGVRFNGPASQNKAA